MSPFSFRLDGGRLRLGAEEASPFAEARPHIGLGEAVRFSAKLVRPWIFPTLIFGIWWVVSATGIVRPLFLPPPWAVYAELAENYASFLAGLQSSLIMVLLGLSIGAAAGIGSGLAIGFSPVLRIYGELALDLLRPVPLFALIPLFVLWFGIGIVPEIALIALAIGLFLSLATIEAIRNVPQVLIRAALTLGATRLQIYRTVVVPAIIPQMIGAIRFAVASAWGLDVAAEFSGSQKGLGYIMIVREQYLDTAGIVAVVLIFCALAVLADRLTQAALRPLVNWKDSPRTDRRVGELLGW